MYVHKRDVIRAYEIASEDGVLHTREYSHPVFKGERIATGLDGGQFVITKEYAEHLIEVDIKDGSNSSKKVVYDLEKGYADGVKLNQNEDADYIEGKQDGWNNYHRCIVGKK